MAAAAAAAAPVGGDAAAAVAQLAALGDGGDQGAIRLAQLTLQKQQLQAAKKTNQQTIKNEKAKRKRIQDKAKKLSTSELLEVVVLRAAAEAKAKAKAKAKAAAGP
jgi:hypothetical protein